MISDEAQLAQSRTALERLEGALHALRNRVHPTNPRLFEAMAEDYILGIKQIRSEIEDYIGQTGAEEAIAPLWMVLEGRALATQDISSRLLAEWLGRLRKSVYRVAAYLETGVVRRSGRPDGALLYATDPHVLALKPGSIRIGLRLPPAEVQSELFPSEQPRAAAPAAALERLLLMMRWAVSGSLEMPRDEFPDTDEAALVAQEAARLVPSPQGAVRTVQFSGALVPAAEPIRASAEVGLRLIGLASMLSHVTEQTVTGTIREIDLDARRVILRERGEGLSDLKCYMDEVLILQAEALLDQVVTVTGLIASATPDTVQVQSIELAVN